MFFFFFFFNQKTAYEMRISDWSSDVCSSDLIVVEVARIDVLQDRIHGLPLEAHTPVQLPAIVELPLVGDEAGDVVAIIVGVDREERCAGEPFTGNLHTVVQIGRASCRERVCQYV